MDSGSILFLIFYSGSVGKLRLFVEETFDRAGLFLHEATKIYFFWRGVRVEAFEILYFVLLLSIFIAFSYYDNCRALALTNSCCL